MTRSSHGQAAAAAAVRAMAVVSRAAAAAVAKAAAAVVVAGSGLEEMTRVKVTTVAAALTATPLAKSEV